VPVRRLVLPREVAGVNAVEVSGPLASAPTGPGDVVVLVVPSTARVVQAGWLQALRRRSWSRFADWLPGALEDPEGSWRWDRLAARWAGEVGADRVHVVAGDAPDAAAETLTVLAGEPVSVSGWARTLIGAEVAAVESLVAELEELGLGGRNAADLLDGAVAAMVRTPAVGGTAPAADAVPEQERVAAEAGRMLAALEESGIHVHGDRAALTTTAPAAGSAERVGLAAAVALSVGALERVTTWARAEGS
jgi:hypothetical protein